MRVVLKTLFLIITILIFGGCAEKKQQLPKLTDEISVFLKKQITKETKTDYKNYIKKYFKPWSIKKIDTPLSEIKWAENFVNKRKVYGENRVEIPRKRLDSWIKNTNYKALNSFRRYAITTYPTNLRAFPTDKPIFLNPNSQSEGYPFDYNQNSLINALTPIFISHYSSDGGWAYVQTPFALGWIKSRDFALISKKRIRLFKRLPKVIVVKDNTPIYDNRQNFLFYAKLGTIFPYYDRAKNFYKILYPEVKGKYIVLKRSRLSKYVAKKMPLKFNSKNIKRISSELLDEPYGWGGIANDRDCSAMTRDFFAPFGIWLPRNSKAQSQVGKVISLSKMSDDDKEKTIIEQGIPFQTLIYLPGHIMLYIGTTDKKVYAMHNMWGIRTQKDGRYIIGKAIISNLHLGEELAESDKDALLIKRIKSINIIGQ